MNAPVTQPWVHGLSFMQQSVLLSALRGPDGVPKRHKAKPMVRWFRRCVLIAAFEKTVITDPGDPRGGSFTGPAYPYRPGKWEDLTAPVLDDFVDSRDELPYHYQVHFMHAAEVLGYKHPDTRIRVWWEEVYRRLVHTMHVWPETETEMDDRLGDDEQMWASRSDESLCCSD